MTTDFDIFETEIEGVTNLRTLKESLKLIYDVEESLRRDIGVTENLIEDNAILKGVIITGENGDRKTTITIYNYKKKFEKIEVKGKFDGDEYIRIYRQLSDEQDFPFMFIKYKDFVDAYKIALNTFFGDNRNQIEEDGESFIAKYGVDMSITGTRYYIDIKYRRESVDNGEVNE